MYNAPRTSGDGVFVNPDNEVPMDDFNLEALDLLLAPDGTVLLVLNDPRCLLFHGDSAKLDMVLAENSVDAIVTDPPAGIGFMGKGWDSDKGGRDSWIAWLAATLAPSFRALKPGGHALVWAIPRTAHWTAMALEEVGFQIIDRVTHLFSNGAAKSRNLGRDLDMKVCNLPGRHCDKHLPRSRLADDHLCPYVPAHDPMRGMGTGLSPAGEDWYLARKPFDGTYAHNYQEHGTGWLNIDDCRTACAAEDLPPVTRSGKKGGDHDQVYGHSEAYESRVSDKGRWPKNVVLDESAAEELDAAHPPSVSRRGKPRSGQAGEGWGMTHTGAEYNDRGGPSRFFYVCKGSRDKHEGLEHLPARTGGQATGRADDSEGVRNFRAGAGRTGGARNFHPTVKSTALMRWLIRLITPPGGTVLDPFAGSGSTGVAALEEGMRFVGCEQGGENNEYLPIILGRLRHALGA